MLLENLRDANFAELPLMADGRSTNKRVTVSLISG